MTDTIGKGVGQAYVVTTLDTKKPEAVYVRDLIEAAGIATTLVDVGTRSDDASADISAVEVAHHHPEGSLAVFSDDRGDAITVMAMALRHLIGLRDNVGGIIGLGGSGGTSIIAPAMRALPVGIPKVMVSTLASSDVSAYVGPSDLFMHHPVTDLAGLNRVSRRVLANAAHAIAGMMTHTAPTIEDSKPALGLTMFGVTTICVNALTAALEHDYDCLVFHATGTGGRCLEQLVDGGDLVGVVDITTTEVCDFLLGGVLSAGEDRLGAIARSGVPYVGSCGALDMVNFFGMDSVPERYRGRRLHRHNAQVTLMRTNAEECERIGRWIGEKLNTCNGPVEFLLPLRGLSAIDVEGAPFYDPDADAALFQALYDTVIQTDSRQLHTVDAAINDPLFVAATLEALHRATVS
jgi:uncharacterized protein (UPF0261 family)